MLALRRSNKASPTHFNGDKHCYVYAVLSLLKAPLPSMPMPATHKVGGEQIKVGDGRLLRSQREYTSSLFAPNLI